MTIEDLILDPGDRDGEVCPSCMGTGDAYIPRDGRPASPCPACGGSGDALYHWKRPERDGRPTYAPADNGDSQDEPEF